MIYLQNVPSTALALWVYWQGFSEMKNDFWKLNIYQGTTYLEMYLIILYHRLVKVTYLYCLSNSTLLMCQADICNLREKFPEADLHIEFLFMNFSNELLFFLQCNLSLFSTLHNYYFKKWKHDISFNLDLFFVRKINDKTSVISSFFAINQFNLTFAIS